MYKINSFYIFDTTLKVQKFPIPRLRFLAVFRNHSAIFPGYTGNDMVMSLVQRFTCSTIDDQMYCRPSVLSNVWDFPNHIARNGPDKSETLYKFWQVES